MVFLLSEALSDPTITDRWGKTPADDAEAAKHEQVANFLRSYRKPRIHEVVRAEQAILYKVQSIEHSV